jgi:hypothetical protein
VNRLIYLLNDVSINKKNIPVFLDNTLIKENVNIELNIGPLLEGDINDLNAQLQKFGLTLVPKQEKIDMLVIGD